MLIYFDGQVLINQIAPAFGYEEYIDINPFVAGVITIVDLMSAARIINSRFYSPCEAFLTAEIFYMAITFLIIWLLKKLEFKWFAHLRRE